MTGTGSWTDSGTKKMCIELPPCRKWWLGTDGTYFGLFLESPWPFVLAWSCFGFSSFVAANDAVAPDALAVVMLINCVAQGVDAGILIQQGGNAIEQKFS